MKNHTRILAAGTAALLLHSAPSHATLISGFESGLLGWEYIGDLSVQTSAIGTAPSEGLAFALISTLCDRRVESWCETTVFEDPYSGVSSVVSVDMAGSAADFLALPTHWAAFGASFPTPPGNPPRGESGALRIRFHAEAGSILLFDWNHIRLGVEADTSYFSLWNEDPLEAFHLTDYLWDGSAAPSIVLNVSGLNLCDRVGSPFCDEATFETGYFTRAVTLPVSGWYGLGFALFEVEEGTVPSALAIDNVRLVRVPEPGGLPLLLGSALLLGFLARDRRLRGVKVASPRGFEPLLPP